ncbi:ExbD/TolR family protein [Rehaibacterium terrae]|jgi:biopolymer transport protein ExbD|uniref:Biopolymer transport protein ExbD n=1 Tax=Rehaibacterium terrae TaxID=1341696 RepID=A0A7W7Y173_9GAMM|nr:biopolymer transporter ExbD [Rehaibacterium terrae]MBB5016207.1 biopolymer transport protein ExbD [Rehaibacterium terrae]
MRLDSGRLRDEPEISLTSLIDVVFTLIIFFVVTTTFDARSALKLQLPRADAPPTLEQPQTLTITVDVEGRYYVGNEEVLRRDAAALREAVRRVAGDDRDRPVMVRADARTPHQAVVTAIDVLGQLGFRQIAIPTAPEETR